MGCSSDTSLARLMEARRLSAQLRVQFSQAADAANRAVMADTDTTSAAFAREAEQLSQAVQQDADALAPLLTSLRYADESRLLEEFRGRFAEYRALDRDILQLAAEGYQPEGAAAVLRRRWRSGRRVPGRARGRRARRPGCRSLAGRGAGCRRRAGRARDPGASRRPTSPRPTTRR